MVERSYGIILVKLGGMEPKYLLIQDQTGHWGFPKGQAEPGENARQTIKRELFEATGLRDCRLEEKTYEDQYHFTRSEQVIVKSVKYYLGMYTAGDTRPSPPGIRAVRWVTRGEALDLLTFHSSREILRNAHSYLESNDLNKWA